MSSGAHLNTAYRVRGGRPTLQGEVRVPGDKSIGHRALLFAALARGTSNIRRLGAGLDNRATAQALRQMGVPIEWKDSTARVQGVGLDGLRASEADIDCGNSGTTMRLLAGLLAAQPFSSRLVGDASLSRRPMRRVVRPLQDRGAVVDGRRDSDDLYPPLHIGPVAAGQSLHGLNYDLPVASAQVKSALLLSGLYADGPTHLTEPVLSRDHTERMLRALGVPLVSDARSVVLRPQGWVRSWNAFSIDVPGDLSSAAFLLAAGQGLADRGLTIRDVGINPTRTGYLDALQQMGAAVRVEARGEGALGEPVGDLHVSAGPLQSGAVGGELLTRMIDEVPALCVGAALAQGRVEIRDAAELRVKESDRIAAMAEVLQAFGVPCQELPDGLVIEGGKPLRPARVTSRGDHRIAMSAVVLALSVPGESWIEDVDCVATSFPGFDELLRTLGADVVVMKGGA